jgi:uncharacterized protein (DUF169 family)
MESKLQKALNLKYPPIALLWSDEKPKNAMQFKEGKWGCVMFLYNNALKGNVSVADANTYGCWGGGVGLGFGNQYTKFPGGISGFCYFLSYGNKHNKKAQDVVKQLSAYSHSSFVEDFVEGERYVKDPDLVNQFVLNLPMFEVPKKYVILKQLSQVEDTEEPILVSFLVDANQLSALVILSNYDRSDFEGSIIPYAAGCQTLGIFTYKECFSNNPRCVVGFTDISARNYIKNAVSPNYLMFNMPLKRFLQLESFVEGSFLEKTTWLSLIK